jgi:hypothetical protein
VGCYSEQDGATEVILAHMRDVKSAASPVFDGDLDTPNRAVMVSTADYEQILSLTVPNIRTHVRIWTNHPRWPTKITIGVE